jgi:hypothetical protein
MNLDEYKEWQIVGEKNGVCYSTFWNRVKKLKWSPEKAATTLIKNRPNKKHKKWLEVATQNGINETTFKTRIGRGWTPEKAAATPKTIYRDHNHWLELAKENGIKASNYHQRIYKGWRPERAATEPLKNNLEHKEWLKLAEQNGISPAAYNRRINESGWSRKKAATEPIKSRDDREWSKIAVQNGIHRDTFYYRVDQCFWTPEEAATTKPMPTEQIIEKATGLLKEYRAIEHERLFKDKNNLFKATPQHFAIAEGNGISKGTVKSRIYKLGWTIQEAITVPVRKALKKPEGYDKYYQLAIQNGLSRITFRDRIRNGWDLEEAATKSPLDSRNRRRMDKEWIDLAIENGIGYRTYLNRVDRLGWTPKEAATTKKLSKGEYSNAVRKERSLEGYSKFRKG